MPVPASRGARGSSQQLLPKGIFRGYASVLLQGFLKSSQLLKLVQAQSLASQHADDPACPVGRRRPEEGPVPLVKPFRDVKLSVAASPLLFTL